MTQGNLAGKDQTFGEIDQRGKSKEIEIER
jgi:hypothetical protein